MRQREGAAACLRFAEQTTRRWVTHERVVRNAAYIDQRMRRIRTPDQAAVDTPAIRIIGTRVTFVVATVIGFHRGAYQRTRSRTDGRASRRALHITRRSRADESSSRSPPARALP